MKYLKWIKENVNFISLVAGISLMLAGYDEVGKILVSQGGLP